MSNFHWTAIFVLIAWEIEPLLLCFTILYDFFGPFSVFLLLCVLRFYLLGVYSPFILLLRWSTVSTFILAYMSRSEFFIKESQGTKSGEKHVGRNNKTCCFCLPVLWGSFTPCLASPKILPRNDILTNSGLCGPNSDNSQGYHYRHIHKSIWSMHFLTGGLLLRWVQAVLKWRLKLTRTICSSVI